MKKRAFSILLAAVMVLTLAAAVLPGVAAAATGSVDDPWDISETAGTDNVKATLVDGVLTISGMGKTKSYTASGSGQPWSSKQSQITSVVVNPGVTYVRAYALSGLSKLKSVTLPEGLTAIGNYCFADCKILEKVTIPKTVTNIWAYAFNDCTSLKTVVVKAETIITLNEDPFNGCTALEAIYVPADKVEAYKAASKWSNYESIIQGMEMPPDSCDGTHTGWTAWDKTDTLPADAGKYYLTKDVELSSGWAVKADIMLCLNGFVIKRNGGNAVTVNSGATLTLYDCGEKEHFFDKDGTGLWVLNETSGKESVTGGCIMGVNPDEHTTDGVGVFVNAGGTFNMYGGNIVGNTATKGGGGVLNAGTFNMYGGSIVGNTAKIGGGVYNEGTFTLSGGTITGNTATTNGGGVYNKGTLTLNGGAITGNTAPSGGGVYNYNGTFDMTGGEITGNTAPSGGGVLNAGTFNMYGGNVVGNTALSQGGGVYNKGTLTLTGGTISGNTASGGGGVYNHTINSTFTMNGGAITGNTAGDSGGGVYNFRGTFEMNGGTIAGNTAKNGDSSFGGGGVYTAGTFTMNGGTISDNAAPTAGGVFVNSAGTFTLGGTAVIAGNKDKDGKANDLYMSDGTVSIATSTNAPKAGMFVGLANGTVTGAQASDVQYFFSNDAAKYVKFDTDKLSLDTIPSGKKAQDLLTGDLYDQSFQDALTLGGKFRLLDDCKFSGPLPIDGVDATLDLAGHVLDLDGDQIALTNGGKLTIIDSNPTTEHKFKVDGTTGLWSLDNSGTKTVTGGVITGGSAINGGAVNVDTGCALTLNGGNIVGNTGSSQGGGVYNMGTLTLNGGAITGNTASSGGGVYNYNNCTFKMTGGVISDNTAGTNEAGGVYVSASSTFEMNGGEIAGNTANKNGGGVYVYAAGGEYGTLKMTGGAITGNTAKGNGGGVCLYRANGLVGGVLEMTGGEITGNTASSGGGVYGKYATLTLGGTAVIKGNTKDGKANDLYMSDGTATIGTGSNAPKAGMRVGLANGTVNGAQASDVEYFFSNNVTKYVKFDTDKLVLADKTKIMTEAQLADFLSTNGGIGYLANDIKRETNNFLNVNTNVTLDLAGHVLDLNGHYIEVKGGKSLTIEDSDPTAEHKCKVDGTTGLWTLDAEGTETVKGGIITGGRGATGAVVVMENGTFTMEAGNLVGNTSTGRGAAVFVNKNGAFTLNGGAIIGNTAQNGAVYTNGIFTMNGGTIADNTSKLGGGVYVNTNGIFTMNGGEISGNKASKDGGGVYNNTGKFTMNGGTISGNAATGNGGGVYVYENAAFTMNGGKITKNTATETGGGVYAKGTFTMKDGEISENAASTCGGVYTDGTFELTGGKIKDNKATGYHAGGVYVYENAAFTMNGGEISGNTALYYGGGVYVNKGKFELISGKISGNKADAGGGIYICGDSDAKLGEFTMTGGEVSGNTAENGGGVNVNGYGKFTLSGGTISGNKATSTVNGGGGVYVIATTYGYGTFTMTDGVIKENTATNGAGVYVFGDMTMSGGEIKDNKASSGGGVCVNASTFGHGTLAVSGGTISGNTALNGGGVYVYKNSTFTLTAGEISGNTASCGGGVYTKGTFTLSGGKVKDNKATSTVNGGGGVYVDTDGKATMTAGEISGNEATKNGGGVYIVTNTSFTLTAGKVSGNKASSYGGGIYNYGSLTIGKMYGTTAAYVSDNTVTNNGAGIYNSASGTANIYSGTFITGNKTTGATGNGGGIHNVGTCNLSGVTIAECSAYRGGGIYNIKGFVGYTSSRIDKCTATYGGGVYVTAGARFETSGGAITDCEAAKDGGAVYVDAPNGDTHNFATFANGVSLTGNKAVSGGAIYSKDVIGLETATISGNTATAKCGGLYIASTGNIFVGKAAVVKDNTLGNLTLADGIKLTFGSNVDVPKPISGMELHVTSETVAPDGKIRLSTNGTDAYASYVIPDDPAQKLKFEGGAYYLIVPAAKIGSTYYESFAEAVNAVKDGQTIVLLKDATGSVTISRKVSFKIDANGFANNAKLGASSDFDYKTPVVSGNITSYQVLKPSVLRLVVRAVQSVARILVNLFR